jgi:alkaline phosphatase D
LVEALEHNLARDHPLRQLFLVQRAGEPKPDPAINLLMRHGVRACLEYHRTGDLERARRLSNPDVAPHLSFLDMGGHGYATVRVSGDDLACEFVCIPRPITRAEAPDGGPLLYRVEHRVRRWQAGERPKLDQRVLEGNPQMAL